MSKKNKTIDLTLSALFLALGMVLPLLTGQIKEIGDTLLPLHLVVMFCSLICGWKYGFVTGLALPYLRSLVFQMPPLYPAAVWMSFELAAYGVTLGLLYNKFGKNKTSNLIWCLLISMLSGRIVWGICKTILLMGTSNPFSFALFISGGFIDALPGIILQLILIPLIMDFYNKRISK